MLKPIDHSACEYWSFCFVKQYSGACEWPKSYSTWKGVSLCSTTVYIPYYTICTVLWDGVWFLLSLASMKFFTPLNVPPGHEICLAERLISLQCHRNCRCHPSSSWIWPHIWSHGNLKTRGDSHALHGCHPGEHFAGTLFSASWICRVQCPRARFLITQPEVACRRLPVLQLLLIVEIHLFNIEWSVFCCSSFVSCKRGLISKMLY